MSTHSDVGDAGVVELVALGSKTETVVEALDGYLGVEEDLGESAITRVVDGLIHEVRGDPAVAKLGEHGQTSDLCGVAVAQDPERPDHASVDEGREVGRGGVGLIKLKLFGDLLLDDEDLAPHLIRILKGGGVE